MDPYGWNAKVHGGGGPPSRCWERSCRSTDPSPMRPIEHSMRSTETMRSLESMRSMDSMMRQQAESMHPMDMMRPNMEHRQSRSIESIRSIEQLRPMDQPRSMDPPSSSASMRNLDHYQVRAMEHPCRLMDHAGHMHDHYLGRGHDHGCHSVEHVPRLVEHRGHETYPGRPGHCEPPMCRSLDHGVRAINYSCRSLDHASGRPLPMDSVIFGPHSHPPPRLPAESPYRMNCPVHSPFRFRFPNGDFHSHQVRVFHLLFSLSLKEWNVIRECLLWVSGCSLIIECANYWSLEALGGWFILKERKWCSF